MRRVKARGQRMMKEETIMSGISVNTKLVEGLNEQFNREISTALRYMVSGAQISGSENEAIREMYLGEVQDEIGHAQYLANQLVVLGSQPKLQPDLTPPPTEVGEMLRKDIAAELEDVKHYRKLAELADEEGLMALKLQMEEQAAEEDQHGQQMTRMLGD